MLSRQQLALTPQPTVYFGVGEIERLPEAVRSTGYDRAFLVTDQGLRSTPIPDRLLTSLRSAAIETAVFDGVVANPSTRTVDAGAGLLRSFGPAAVVALGGGSSIDVAKALGLAGANPGSGRDFDYHHRQPHPGLPVVAVPTTAGTGAETNAFGVIDDPVAGEKFYVGDASVLPRVVICDPLLTTGLPPRPTAATGMDAMAHALEALSSRNANPLAEGIAFQVARMVARWLPVAVASGQDLEARSQMLLASHMAGMAFATGTGLGLAHGIAHSLSARAGTVHGEALAALLPHVLRYNLPACEQRYARLAEVFGVSDPGQPAADNAARAIDAVATLAARIGLDSRLAPLGCTRALIPQVAADAVKDEVTLNAPRFPTEATVRELLAAAL